MTFRADLHTHSTFSDGSFTPIELLDEAVKIGLQGLSITDHDTIDAYSEELFHEAKKREVLLLAGSEVSTRHREHDIHILAYGIDLKSQLFRSFLTEIQERRNERNRGILLKLQEHKMPIYEEELLALREKEKIPKILGRAHIAYLMVEKKYVGSIQEAFQRFLKDGGPCFVPGNKFSPMDAIQQIHMAKGKAVLAHPHFITHNRIVKDLLEMPFDGLECYYAKLGPEQEKRWVGIAKEKSWLATGGSDFHGAMKPYIPLGCSWVGEETFFRIYESAAKTI
ncbi:MAG TPA: PHP domain-containing protein [Chlamydiales bacterium]|nr:PHP domain-containing protein [Chlamydiales bacterium]